MAAAFPKKKAVPLKHAAHELGVDVSTIRRWVDQGAPAVSLGRQGRGRSTMVSVSDLREWRAAQAGVSAPGAIDFDAIARGLASAFRGGTNGNTRPVWEELGVGSGRAALVLAEAYKNIHKELTGREPSDAELPADIEKLHGCAFSLLSRLISTT